MAMRGRTLLVVVAVEALALGASLGVVACNGSDKSPSGDLFGDRPNTDASLGQPKDAAGSGEGGEDVTPLVDAPADTRPLVDTGAGD